MSRDLNRSSELSADPEIDYQCGYRIKPVGLKVDICNENIRERKVEMGIA